MASPRGDGRAVLAHLAELGMAGQRVVIQRDGGGPMLAQAVADLGADVVDVPVYQWSVQSTRVRRCGCSTPLRLVGSTP